MMDVERENTPRIDTVLYHHEPMTHQPVNPNWLHDVELAAASLNKKTAILVTHLFQSMITFWFFFVLLVAWVVYNSLPGFPHFDPYPFILLNTSYSAPQLPVMIALGVGIALLGRKQELMSDEQYRTTMQSYKNIQAIMEHLNAQDAELLKQSQLLLEQQQRLLTLSALIQQQVTAQLSLREDKKG